VFLTSRRVAGNTIGIGAWYLADKDATMARVPVVAADSEGGNGLELTPIPGGVVPTTLAIGASWSIGVHEDDPQNPGQFAWVTLHDYILKTEGAKGFQAAVLRVDRDGTIGKVRKTVEFWDAAAATNHGHSSIVDSLHNCIYVVRGDGWVENTFYKAAFDLSDYENTEITISVIHGGFDATGATSVGTIHTYAMRHGTSSNIFYGPGDQTNARVIRGVADEDSLTLSEMYGGKYRNRTATQSFGFNYWPGGPYLHGGYNSFLDEFYISDHGRLWAAANLPYTPARKVMAMGPNLLISYDPATGKIWKGPRPHLDVIKPLQLAPGGDNLNDVALPTGTTSPESGNTTSDVVWDGTEFTEASVPLDPQPELPPFRTDTPIKHCINGALFDGFGNFYLTAGSIDWIDIFRTTDVWVCNLSKDRVIRPSMRSARTGAGQMPVRIDEAAGYLQWTPCTYSGTATAGTAARAQMVLIQPADTLISEGSDFLLALVSYTETQLSAPYPLGMGNSGPDELEQAVISTGDTWTVLLQFEWPRSVSPDVGNATFPVATLWEDATNYADLSVVHTSTTAGNVVVDLVVGGVSAGTLSVAVDVQPNDVVDVVFSNTGAAQFLSVRNHRLNPVTDSDTLTAAISPVELRWSNNDQSVVSRFHPIFAGIVDGEAYDAAAAAAWMKQPFGVKVDVGRAAGQPVACLPGDFISQFGPIFH
jgi:hypothetical protein